MLIDQERLQSVLCERLCRNIRISKRNDNVLMLDNPFTFPDGDHYPIYLSESSSGELILSDCGHTMMHISYDHDVDQWYDGPRAVLREQIVREYQVQENDGIFSVETSVDQVSDALFRLCQALTKIYDMSFLSKERVISTFYEDLNTLLLTIIEEDRIEQDYIPSELPFAEAYPVDYRIKGENGESIFLFGVANRDKARLATIMLSHFLLNNLIFESIIVFANQQEIPRLDLARLTNVSGPAVASLDAKDDLERKIHRLAA